MKTILLILTTFILISCESNGKKSVTEIAPQVDELSTSVVKTCNDEITNEVNYVNYKCSEIKNEIQQRSCVEQINFLKKIILETKECVIEKNRLTYLDIDTRETSHDLLINEKYLLSFSQNAINDEYLNTMNIQNNGKCGDYAEVKIAHMNSFCNFETSTEKTNATCLDYIESILTSYPELNCISPSTDSTKKVNAAYLLGLRESKMTIGWKNSRELLSETRKVNICSYKAAFEYSKARFYCKNNFIKSQEILRKCDESVLALSEEVKGEECLLSAEYHHFSGISWMVNILTEDLITNLSKNK